jgi:uncharacterized membrane protein
MKAPFMLTLLLAAGCTASSTPYNPVEDVRYSAIGENPFWLLTIGDDSIVLGSGPGPGSRGGINGHRYRRVLPTVVDGVRRWESSDGTAVISVEARPGPCTGSRGARFEDRVRVRLSGRELNGCGGRKLSSGGA